MADPSKTEKANHANLKRFSRNSFTMKRVNERANATTDVATDVIVCVSGTSFSLHKFPLVSKSRLMRNLVAEANSSNLHILELSDIPGGAEAFELAAKFCYGIKFEITNSNVAMLRCVAEHLEMTDDYGEKNLVTRTETFLKEVGTQSLSSAIEVLHTCENLLPMAEEIKIINRCIDAAALIASLDQDISKFHSDVSSSDQVDGKLNLNFQPIKGLQFLTSWAKDLSTLRLDFFKRVLGAMRSRGVHHESIWEALMHYAQCSLNGFTWQQEGLYSTMQSEIHDSKMPGADHEQRLLLETLVSLLPSERSTATCGFLFCLLRTAIVLDTTVACRLDLERRISMQLEEATLDDLIPSSSHNSDSTVCDVDLVHQVVISYLQQQENTEFHGTKDLHGSDQIISPTQASISNIGRLLDSYLAEVAPDANLNLNKFLALVELLPEHARMADDGLYRAIDMYLKAHPSVSDLDRKKLCKVLDPQKLSPAACAHAAQNERLHAQFMVQVLYMEHLKLRTALDNFLGEREQLGKLIKVHSGQVSASASPRVNHGFLRQENQELKLELAKMRGALSDLEKEHLHMKKDVEKLPTIVVSRRIFQTVSKKMGRLSRFASNNSKEQKNLAGPNSSNSREPRYSMS